MEILKNLKRNIFVKTFLFEKIYIHSQLILRIYGIRETREINGSRILMGLQYE